MMNRVRLRSTEASPIFGPTVQDKIAVEVAGPPTSNILLEEVRIQMLVTF